ncbi:hypothetical protein [[Eubacterium] cellulosolvens]
MFIASFAALYGVLRLVPIFAWIGGQGRVFTASDFVVSLYGILLGPYVGSASVIVGTFLGIAFTGRTTFFGLDFVPAMMNTLTLGFLIRRKRIVSVSLFTAMLVLFFLHPYTPNFLPVPNTSIVFPFLWLHLLAYAVLLSPLNGKAVTWVTGPSTARMIPAVLVLSLIGTMAQHLAGNLLFASMATAVMGLTPSALALSWGAIFVVYPIERGLIVGVTTIVGAAVIKALRAAGLGGAAV